MKCANSEESDQTAFERSLIRLYTVCKDNDGLLRNVTSKSNILRNANTVLSGSLLFSYHWKVLMSQFNLFKHYSNLPYIHMGLTGEILIYLM